MNLTILLCLRITHELWIVLLKGRVLAGVWQLADYNVHLMTVLHELVEKVEKTGRVRHTRQKQIKLLERRRTPA